MADEKQAAGETHVDAQDGQPIFRMGIFYPGRLELTANRVLITQESGSTNTHKTGLAVTIERVSAVYK